MCLMHRAPFGSKIWWVWLKHHHSYPSEKSVCPRHGVPDFILSFALKLSDGVCHCTTQNSQFVKRIPAGSWGLNFLLRLFISDSLSPPFAFLCGMSISLLERRCHSYGHVKAIKYYNQNIGDSKSCLRGQFLQILAQKLLHMIGLLDATRHQFELHCSLLYDLVYFNFFQTTIRLISSQLPIPSC